MTQRVMQSIETSHQRLYAQANRVTETLFRFGTGQSTDCGRLQDQLSVLLDEYRESHEPLIKQAVARLIPTVGLAQELLQTTVGAHGSHFCETLNKLIVRMDGLHVGQMVAREDIFVEGMRMLQHLQAQVEFEQQALLSNPGHRERPELGEWAIDRTPTAYASGAAA